jgi:peptide-methionine (S)-S-oxide reductase
MKNLLLLSIATSLFASCSSQPTPSVEIPVGEKRTPAKGEQVATFAEGCFWHSEIVFQSLKGVRDAVSGYAGGSIQNPSYQQVVTGTTGHAESVQVFYDPAVVSYRTLVQAFLASQDPTQVDGQGYDEGPQYRTVAFYRNADEKKIIDEEIARLKASGKYKAPIATQVAAFTGFYPAEAYHQEFVSRHPDQAYVRNVSIPDYQKFRASFKGPFKQ